MIVKLCKKSVVIEDVNQHECMELEKYDVLYHGIPAGSSLYALDIRCPGNKYPIMIRTNNLVIIDKR